VVTGTAIKIPIQKKGKRTFSEQKKKKKGKKKEPKTKKKIKKKPKNRCAFYSLEVSLVK